MVKEGGRGVWECVWAGKGWGFSRSGISGKSVHLYILFLEVDSAITTSCDHILAQRLQTLIVIGRFITLYCALFSCYNMQRTVN